MLISSTWHTIKANCRKLFELCIIWIKFNCFKNLFKFPFLIALYALLIALQSHLIHSILFRLTLCLREGLTKKRGVVFLRGRGVDTLMHTILLDLKTWETFMKEIIHNLGLDIAFLMILTAWGGTGKDNTFELWWCHVSCSRFIRITVADLC